MLSGDLTRSIAALGSSIARILAWGETERVATLRRDIGDARSPGAGSTDAGSTDADPSWQEQLWRVSSPPEIARRVNDRRYGLNLAHDMDLALPGSEILTSLHELDRHLAQGGHAAGHQGAWVLKAPLSASGRLRVRRRGPLDDQAIRTRVRRLFDRCGELVFEPWVDRVADFGCLGMVTGDRVLVLPPHRLYTDRARCISRRRRSPGRRIGLTASFLAQGARRHR